MYKLKRLTQMSTSKCVTFKDDCNLKPYKRLQRKPMWNEMCTGVSVKRDPENIGWVASDHVSTEKDQVDWIIDVIQPAINKNKWGSYELCALCYEPDINEKNTVEFSFHKININCCKCHRTIQIPKWYYNYAFRHQLYINSFMMSKGFNNVVDGCDVLWYKDSDVNTTISLNRNNTN